MEYLTLKEIAHQLDLTESTARNYRDRARDFLQVKGTGRKRRYHPDAVEVLRFVALAMDKQLTQLELEDELARTFHRIIDVSPETQRNTTAPQQPAKFDIVAAMKSQSASLETITQAVLRLVVENQETQQRNQILAQEVAELRQEVAKLASLQGTSLVALAGPEQPAGDEKKPKRPWWWPFGK